MSRKKGAIVVFMFILTVVLIHPGMPAVLAQEVARSSAEGITSQSFPPLNHARHARLAGSGGPSADDTKLETPAGPPASQVLQKHADGTDSITDSDPGENDKCDCADRFFPQRGSDNPAIQ